VLQVLFRKGPLPNRLAPLLFVGTMGKSCWITSWIFLGVGSREIEGIREVNNRLLLVFALGIFTRSRSRDIKNLFVLFLEREGLYKGVWISWRERLGWRDSS
jgi:hypothetical protein